MTIRKISRAELLACCGELGPEDGVDPRRVRRDGTSRPSRKALQLCEQVARTLAAVLAESGDDLLRDLTVESVTPAPHTGRLLVTVAPAAGPAAVEHVARHLEHAHGRLRSEVAAAVNRRQAPDVVFRVVC
jgi:ribosome-binding factor A